MTQARAVIHVVGAEPLADQLLDEVRLLVRALRRPEAGERGAAVAVADRGEPARRAIERLLPARLAEVGEGVRGVDLAVGGLRCVVAPDEGGGETMGMGHVVEAEPPLHAQAVVVGGTVAALHRGDDLGPDLVRRPCPRPCSSAVLPGLAPSGVLGVVPELVGDLAPDSAVRAHAVDLVEREPAVDTGFVDQRRLHQRPGRACLHALAAGDACARAHRVVEVEDDLRADPPPGHADDVVDLHLAAGPHAEVAVDAGVEVDPHRGMAGIGGDGGTARQPALGDIHALGPPPEPRIVLVRDVARRLVGDQHLHHHSTGGRRPLGGGMHHQARCRPALARGREHAFSLHLDHARAAVAVGPVAGLVRVAQMRDVGAETMGDLPDRLAVVCLDLVAVEGESNRFSHLEVSRLP